MIELWAHQVNNLSVNQSFTLLSLSVVAGLGLLVLSMRSDEEIYLMFQTIANDIERAVLVGRITVLRILRRG